MAMRRITGLGVFLVPLIFLLATIAVIGVDVWLITGIG